MLNKTSKLQQADFFVMTWKHVMTSQTCHRQSLKRFRLIVLKKQIVIYHKRKVQLGDRRVPFKIKNKCTFCFNCYLEMALALYIATHPPQLECRLETNSW